MIEVSRPPGQSNRSRAMLALLAVALLVLSSNGAADPAAQTQPRSPVPNADQVASAETQIRELFKNEYATTNAADYLALSRKLLTQALDTSNDMPSRYVLYRESRDIAARVNNLGQAWLAVDEMAKVFEVNAPALKLEALEVVASTATSQSGNEKLAAAAMPVAEAAMALDDFATAEKLLKIAEKSARTGQNVSQVRAVGALSANLAAMRKEHANFKEATEVLANNPKDPDANLAVGKYRCFFKEDWTAGLPRLAQGSDAALKALAEKTLKEPVDTGALTEIAAGWWDIADKLGDKERAAARRFSAERYRAVAPRLSGLKKELAEKRIAEGGNVRRFNLIPLIDTNRDSVNGTWRIDKNYLRCDQGAFVPRIQIPYRPPEEYDFIVTFTQPNLRNGINLIMPNKHGATFFWCVSSEGGTGFCLSINRSNVQTKLPAASVILPNTVHTTVVQVRRDGVKCLLDGVLLRQHNTDFSDLLIDGWRETKDKNVLAVACDDPTVFQAIQVIEVTGTGVRTR